MPTETNCPHCRETLTVPDAPQGRLAKCAHCGSIFPLAEALANASAPMATGQVTGEQVARAGMLQSTAPGSREAEGGGESSDPSVSPAEHPAEDRAVERPSGDVSTAAGISPVEAPRAASRVTQTPVSSGASQEGALAGWHLRIPEGRTYGPVDRAKLDRWLQEGRIDADCSLRHGDQGPWIPATTLFPQLEVSPGDQPDVRRPAQLPQTAYAPRPQTHAGHAPHAGAAPTAQYAAGGYNASAYGPASYNPGQPVRRTATSDSYAASPYGAPSNATGSPFRGAQVQPHRGEVVFLLGLFGMLLGCPVFSGAAWYLGGSDLRAMNLGLMNPGGRGMTTFGYVLGIVVSCFWIVAVLVTMLVISVSILTQ
jgi:hypothetical protein